MLNKYLDKEIYRILLFTVLILIISYFANYFEILFYRPQSIHFIRQTDSLSFVVNYFQNGMDFFSPQTFNLTTVDGKAACEFPILYYITAILYFVFGEHEFFLRLINISIVFTGFYYVTKLSYIFLQDWTYSFLITFLVMSSGVILYYTNNFLPDSASLGFSLIGLYHFVNYTKVNKRKSLIYSFSFLTLAGLLKATYMIFPIAVVGIFVIEIFGLKLSEKKIFNNFKLFVILSISSFVIVFAWYYYAISYNKINGDTYFLTHTAPIWELSKTRIYTILDLISNYWKNDYYYPTTFHTFFVLLVLSLVFIKKANKLLLVFTFIILLGSLSYFILFFEKFENHDYYGLLFIPVFLLIILNSFSIIQKLNNNKWVKAVLILGLLVLNILSFNYAIYRSTKRYTEFFKDNSIYEKFNGIKSKLDALNIDNNKTFVVLSDFTRNGSLYYMNKKGWTIKDTSSVSISELELAFKNNPDYLIITEDYFLQNSHIKNRDMIFVQKYKDISIYKLSDLNKFE